MSPREALIWSLANIPEAEATCDHAASIGCESNPPILVDPEERELESRLISCLECRPGGLNPATPSRTRKWLWAGIGGLLITTLVDKPKAADKNYPVLPGQNSGA